MHKLSYFWALITVQTAVNLSICLPQKKVRCTWRYHKRW